MRVRLALLTSLAIAALLVMQVTGCKEKAPEEIALDPHEGHDHAAPEADVPEVADPIASAPTAAAQGSALSVDSIDPNNQYTDEDMQTLSFMVRNGTPEDAAKAVSLLKSLLLDSNHAQVRRSAAGTLSGMADQASAELAWAVEKDPDADVRQGALEALGTATPTPELIATLGGLMHNPDATTRSRALATLINVQFNQEDKASAYRWATGHLGATEDDVNAEIMMKLHQQAQKEGPALVLPPCVEVLETSPDANARQAAACVIGLICAGTNPRQQEFAKLSKATQKEETNKPSPAYLDGLAPLEKAAASDPSPEVRAAAAQGLGYLGQASSAPILGELLEDANEQVRWWAATALITIPADAVAEDLALAATTDKSSRVRRAAVRAIGWLEPGPVVTEAMMAVTHDAVPEVRRAAAVQLGRIGDPAALGALGDLFDDGDEDVRWAAVVAMGELKDPAAAPLLAAIVTDPNPMVANAAETALQKMGIAARRYGTRDEG